MLGALSIGYRAQGPSMQAAAALLMIVYSAAMASFAFIARVRVRAGWRNS